MFLLDLNRTQLDAKPFLDSGIDVMNIAEFLRGFMAKSVEHRPIQSPVIHSGINVLLDDFIDSRL